MRFGFQTIVFGSKIDNLEGVLDIVAGCGFGGVEFSQTPQRLWRRGATGPVSRQELKALLDDRGLTFLGLSGGSLEQRMGFCGGERGADAIRPNYLYVENCTEQELLRAALGRFRLALHPHVFMQNHFLEDAEDVLDRLDRPQGCKDALGSADLQEYGRLYWMPDTAHLFIGGIGLETAMRMVPMERIAAVHLKDWDSAYGRSYHRYAKGFTELGNGDVGPKKALALLSEMGYDGWVVVEQDWAKAEPKAAALSNAAYLRQAGFEIAMDESLLAGASVLKWESPQRRPNPPETSVNVDALAAALLDNVGEELETCYQAVAASAQLYCRCQAVAVWSYSPAREDMNLLAVWTRDADKAGMFPARVAKSQLIGGALSDPSIMRTAVSSAFQSCEEPATKKLLSALDGANASEVVMLPVLNRFNNHHIRFLVTLFRSEEDDREDGQRIDTDILEWIANDMVRVVDSALDDYCSYAAGRVNAIALKHDDLASFLGALVLEARTLVECEGMSVFLVNDFLRRLEVGATSGLTWRVPQTEQYYTKDDATLTGRVWKRNEPVVVSDIRADGAHSPRSWESGPGVDERRNSALLVPLVNTWGKVIGVIRCRNKSRRPLALPDERQASEPAGVDDTPDGPAFTDDDAAVVDTMGQAAAAHLQLLMDNIRRADAVAKLTHELSMPLGVVRGAIDSMLRALERHRDTLPAEIFRYDYPGDILSWSSLMLRLLDNAELYGRQAEDFLLDVEPTWLMADVIAPAVRQVEALVRKRGFDPSRIRYGSFSDIPRLFVDRNRLQQLIFNLLSNSIKYAYPAPELFAVQVEGRRSGDWYELAVQDWGPGIAESERDIIFEEGQRGPEFQNKAVRGQGLGLWFVRRIAEAHGGRVQVTSIYRPTEITVYFPRRLASGPPARKG